MSKCTECLYCKLTVPRTDPPEVRCAKFVFKGTMVITHPFITSVRKCKWFPEQEEDQDDTEE